MATRTADVTRLAEHFAEVTGAEPTIMWRAPGRVNLIGEHTDYNDGFALPFAIAPQVVVAAAARGDGILRIRSRQRPTDVIEVALSRLDPGAVTGWAAYVAGTAWAISRRGVHVEGADIVVDGDVPPGAGLSSSAALESAAAGALLHLAGVEWSAREIAAVARQAENDFVGVPCGAMDQLAVNLARADHALLLDCRDESTKDVPLPLTNDGLAILVIDTRSSHRLVDGEYSLRLQQCRAAARALGVQTLREVDDLDAALQMLTDALLIRRTRHVVTENARVLEAVALLGAGRTRDVGMLMTASHASLRDDYEVSAPALDNAVEAALVAGAYGARMTGAGFGGSAIALVDSQRLEDTRTEVMRSALQHSLPEPRFLLANPVEAAGPLVSA